MHNSANFSSRAQQRVCVYAHVGVALLQQKLKTMPGECVPRHDRVHADNGKSLEMATFVLSECVGASGKRSQIDRHGHAGRTTQRRPTHRRLRAGTGNPRVRARESGAKTAGVVRRQRWSIVAAEKTPASSQLMPPHPPWWTARAIGPPAVMTHPRRHAALSAGATCVPVARRLARPWPLWLGR
jgi:hypothetical protein